MGEVLKPGSVKYQLENGMTLAKTINDAGSVASKKKLLIRKVFS